MNSDLLSVLSALLKQNRPKRSHSKRSLFKTGNSSFPLGAQDYENSTAVAAAPHPPVSG